MEERAGRLYGSETMSGCRCTTQECGISRPALVSDHLPPSIAPCSGMYSMMSLKANKLIAAVVCIHLTYQMKRASVYHEGVL